jgi:hypothetical protein
MDKHPLLQPDEDEEEHAFTRRFVESEEMQERFPNLQVRASIARGEYYKHSRAKDPAIQAAGGTPRISVPSNVNFAGMSHTRLGRRA